MLELWVMQRTPSLPSLPGSLWPGVVTPGRFLSMGQIELNFVLMLNRIVWIRTAYLYEKKDLALNNQQKLIYHKTQTNKQYLLSNFHGNPFLFCRCATEVGKLVVHLYTDRPQMRHYMGGVVLATGVILFSVPDLTVEVSQYNKPSQQIHHVIITLGKTGANSDCSDIVSSASTTKTLSTSRTTPTGAGPPDPMEPAPNGPSLLPEHHSHVSTHPSDSKISVMTFCKTFPFHVIFDRHLQITQLGSALMKMIAPNISTKGLFFGTYFELVRPRVKMDYMSFLSRVNSTFVLRTTQFSRGSDAINEVSRKICLMKLHTIFYLLHFIKFFFFLLFYPKCIEFNTVPFCCNIRLRWYDNYFS